MDNSYSLQKGQKNFIAKNAERSNWLNISELLNLRAQNTNQVMDEHLRHTLLTAHCLFANSLFPDCMFQLIMNFPDRTIYQTRPLLKHPNRDRGVQTLP